MLRIKNWDKHFENNRTRELKKLDWVPVPNDLAGDGYTELMEHPNGAAHLGAWLSLIQVASKCETRGTLSRNGARPHDLQSLSRITRVSVEILQEAIPRLIDIGWLEDVTEEGQPIHVVTRIPQEGAGFPQRDAEIPQQGAVKGREWKGMEFSLGACAPESTPSPSDVVDTDSKQTVSKRTVKEYPAEVEWLAARLIARHPKRRRCGPKEAKEKIQTILKGHQKAEWQAIVEQIDANHVALCASEDWTKEDGQFAKALSNWLAPTMDRFSSAPLIEAAEPTPVFRLMM